MGFFIISGLFYFQLFEYTSLIVFYRNSSTIKVVDFMSWASQIMWMWEHMCLFLRYYVYLVIIFPFITPRCIYLYLLVSYNVLSLFCRQRFMIQVVKMIMLLEAKFTCRYMSLALLKLATQKLQFLAVILEVMKPRKRKVSITGLKTSLQLYSGSVYLIIN